ncbi:hypothetical protein [Massilia sp. BHUDP2]|uniref:hypothetical protein n=1 Tax=Massilia sp. BHUDP2 TaxID=3034505 RepID=UPI0039066F7B
MLTRRAELFRKSCELIAQDRRARGRDYSHHAWLVEQVDACQAAILKMMKDINRALDAFISKD